MNALQHRGDAFQTHTGIHGGLGQGQHLTVRLAVVLHEHHVPDFDVAVTVFFRATGRTTIHIRTVVVKDFGTGTTGTGIAHLPEVVRCVWGALVVANPHDSICRNTNFLIPDIKGFVVGRVNGDPQFFLWQLQPVVAGQEGPGKIDGFTLEVVAKAKVTQHFEKGMVARCIAYVLKVIVFTTCTHALLRGCRPAVIACFAPQEHVFELVHSRVGKQQGRVVRRHQ